MRPVLRPEEIRAAEQPLLDALPEGALMQRAATGLAAVCAGLLDRVYGSRVVLLVGSGNNGGDALYAGAALARRGARVDALLLAPGAHAPGLAALRSAGGRTCELTADLFDDADLVVDGILGIGGRGGLRPDAAAAVARAEASAAVLVAVDVPSGVDATTGEVSGAAVHADVTVTFGALKPGLVVDPGAGHAGQVTVVDIGLATGSPEVAVLEVADVEALVPVPTAESDKYRRGVVGVVAGSAAYTGAAVLATGSALRSGAGMVRYLGPDGPADLIRQRWPEIVVGGGRVQAWVAGPGLGTDEQGEQRLAPVLAASEPAILDADALTIVAARGALERSGPTVLTPHAGELSRLLGVERSAIEQRRTTYARQAAERFGAVVLLKGSTTVVAAPDGRERINPTGTPWLATAGSGDVLSGVIGALLAAGLEPLDAAAVGAFWHGAAGRVASGDLEGHGRTGAPVGAHDVLDALPLARRDFAAALGGLPA